jgi:uncharacterized protein YodC (DUF2158 family)
MSQTIDRKPTTPQTFAIGDVVQLQSGGPKMTVVDTIIKTAPSQNTGKVSYQCAYFDANDTAGLISLLPEALKKPGLFGEEKSE